MFTLQWRRNKETKEMELVLLLNNELTLEDLASLPSKAPDVKTAVCVDGHPISGEIYDALPKQIKRVENYNGDDFKAPEFKAPEPIRRPNRERQPNVILGNPAAQRKLEFGVNPRPSTYPKQEFFRTFRMPFNHKPPFMFTTVEEVLVEATLRKMKAEAENLENNKKRSADNMENKEDSIAKRRRF